MHELASFSLVANAEGIEVCNPGNFFGHVNVLFLKNLKNEISAEPNVRIIGRV
jgi:hypothetical protein